MNFVEVEGLRVRYPEGRGSLEVGSLLIKEGESVLVTGRSGSGKSTLLNSINGVIPHEIEAEEEGEVRVFGINVRESRIQDIARYVGTLLQDPEAQIMNHYVVEELAFGAENLGLPREEILRRIQEVSRIVGVSHLLKRPTSTLSGGEKQRVVLGSVLVMGPRGLVLDEPTSSIDIKGTREILSTLRGLKDRVSMVIAEHKVNRVLDFVDRVLILDKGRIAQDLRREDLKSVDLEEYGVEPLELKGRPEERREGEVVLEAKVRVTDGERVIVDTEVKLRKGVTALMGDNGSGKSTLLKAIAGILPQNLKFQGSVKVDGREVSKAPVQRRGEVIAYLPQEVDLMFTKRTVREEVSFPAKARKKHDGAKVEQLIKLFNLPEDQDPFLLSVGQKRRVAIASLLATGVKVFLLDEPTTGQDWESRKALGEELRSIDGAFLVVTHDPLFVYYYADYAYSMVNGRLTPMAPEDALRWWR